MFDLSHTAQILWALTATLGLHGPAGGPGAAGPEAELVTTFGDDELPEGLDIADDGTIYVGILTTGEVVAIGPGGSVSSVGAVDLDGGFMPGLTLSDTGEIFVTAAAPSAGSDGHGVLQIDPMGGVSLFAEFPLDTFPNHITFDSAGDMFVSDSNPGSLYRVDGATGDVSLWSDDPRLLGQPVPQLGGLPLGANGSVLSKHEDVLYVSNSSTNEILAIEIEPDGSAGTLSCYAGNAPDCEIDISAEVAGPDGLAFHANTLYIASGLNDSIVRISVNGTVETVWSGYPLEWPTVLAFGATPRTKHTLYTTNIDISRLFGGTGDPLPGVVALR